MDPNLYKAIMKNDVAVLDQSDETVFTQTTTTKNTLLHLAVQHERKACVQVILKRCPSWLLLNVNEMGDTALHNAARQSLCDISQLLINHAKAIDNEDVESVGGETVLRQLVVSANTEEDTALHEAARSKSSDIVKLLLEADPEFGYSANSAGETPLYLAVQSNSYDTVKHILNACPDSAHDGPKGKTALHAAAIYNKGIFFAHILELLLRVKPGLTKQVDDYGWTPFHYSVHYGFDFDYILLESDISAAYVRDKNGMFPIHIASRQENHRIIRRLLEDCPDCSEQVDKHGRNYLHIAALEGRTEVVNMALGEDMMTTTKQFINEPDNDGNTPLHLTAKSIQYEIVQILFKDGRVNKSAMNKEHLTAADIFLKEGKILNFDEEGKWFVLMRGLFRGVANPDEDQSEQVSPFEIYEKRQRNFIEKSKVENTSRIVVKMQEASNIHLVVAALVATVTFAAGFTVPGGYKNEGTSALLRKTSFKAFAISNAIAMSLSTLAIIIHFFMKLIDEYLTPKHLMRAFYCTLGAIVAMMLAFVTGTYAILDPSPALSITTCVIGCSFFPFCFYLLRHVFSSPVHQKYFWKPLCLQVHYFLRTLVQFFLFLLIKARLFFQG